MIGYGTFGGNNGPQEVYDAIKIALEAGYKHIDTAYICKLVISFMHNSDKFNNA